MRLVVCSDIHGNSDLLKAMLRDAEALGIKRIICLGDVVGYGPAPAECVHLVREHMVVTVMGNHDAAVAGTQGMDGFNAYAAMCAARHHKRLDTADLKFLATLPYVHTEGDMAFAHGDFVSPCDFNYIFGVSEAACSFDANETARLMFVGHTHRAAVYEQTPQYKINTLKPHLVRLRDGCRYIFNVGSVGRPRGTGENATYCIYDSEQKVVEYRTLDFNREAFAAAVHAADVANGDAPAEEEQHIELNKASPWRYRWAFVALVVATVGALFVWHQTKSPPPSPAPIAVTNSVPVEPTVPSKTVLRLQDGWCAVYADPFKQSVKRTMKDGKIVFSINNTIELPLDFICTLELPNNVAFLNELQFVTTRSKVSSFNLSIDIITAAGVTNTIYAKQAKYSHKVKRLRIPSDASRLCLRMQMHTVGHIDFFPPKVSFSFLSKGSQ